MKDSPVDKPADGEVGVVARAAAVVWAVGGRRGAAFRIEALKIKIIPGRGGRVEQNNVDAYTRCMQSGKIS